MSIRVLALPLLALLVTGCAFAVDVMPTPAASGRAPSAYAEVLRKPPEGATELGRIELQGNNYQSVADCEARCVIEARKLGANAVLVQPEESGFGKGVKCSGVAYAIAK
jgi:hypothetical protein